MFMNRSPPKYKKLPMGGSNLTLSSATSATTSAVGSTTTVALSPMQSEGNPTCRTNSTHSHYTSSSSLLGNDRNKTHYHNYSRNQHGQHAGGSNNGTRSSSSLSAASLKRGKKHNWGTRERAGMSFLIVIAFFAVFGLIILTELFMIDERSHGSMVALRHGSSYGGRLGDSVPDYDNVKDDYDLLDDNFLGDSKLGFVQFRDNKLRVQDADTSEAGRLAGILLNSGYGGGAAGGGGGGGVNVPIIPWGKVLPAKIEETLPHYPFGMTPTDGAWQVVNGTRFKFFVFSAYYDRRNGARLVRVVGATRTRGPEHVWCRFWYLNRNATATDGQHVSYKSVTVMSRVKIIRENWNLKYSACFVLCPVRAPDIEVPHYVSIVSRLRAPPGNVLELRNTDWDVDFVGSNGFPLTANVTAAGASSATTSFSALPTGDQIADRIAVCVKPFHFNYDQALYLMEYLEFYALLGVSHFTFYNHTIGPRATCVLQHYVDGDIPANLTAWDVDISAPIPKTVKSETPISKSSTKNPHNNISNNIEPPAQPTVRLESFTYQKPTVNILPWNLRMRSQKEIRTEGLFAALNDCLYRTMYRYKYLALVDLDEFIVPRHTDTLNELINSVNRRFRNRSTGAYSFQNAFFYLQFPDDTLVTQNVGNDVNERVRAALITQRKTRRRYKLHPQKQRSKYICKPEAVVEAGNHFVWEFAPGKDALNVPPTEAILQHYRVCEFGGNDCIKAPSVVDRTATKYVNRLVQRVETVYNYLKPRCDLPDLPITTNSMRADAKKRRSSSSSNNSGAKTNTISNHNVKSQTITSKTKTNNDQGKSEIKATNTEHLAITKPTTSTTTTTLTTSTITATIKNPNTNTKITTTTTTTTSATVTTLTNKMKTPINATINDYTNTTKNIINNSTTYRKMHKMVFFEEGEDGLPRARVEFVY